MEALHFPLRGIPIRQQGVHIAHIITASPSVFQISFGTKLQISLLHCVAAHSQLFSLRPCRRQAMPLPQLSGNNFISDMLINLYVQRLHAVSLQQDHAICPLALVLWLNCTTRSASALLGGLVSFSRFLSR